MSDNPLKKYSTLGCCGLDCGLCPRYYTEGSSRCPGCGGIDFELKHPSCSFVTCCVKKHGWEVCAQCGDFPCLKFAHENGEADSFVTHRNVLSNQRTIIETGLEQYLLNQKRQMDILAGLLSGYDDGKSKSFLCLCVTLIPLSDLEQGIADAERIIAGEKIPPEDKKNKVQILRRSLEEIAGKQDIELKLRKPK